MSLVASLLVLLLPNSTNRLRPYYSQLETDPSIKPFVTDDRMLKVDRVKIFGDGSLGAGTAAITPDDATSNAAGLLIFTDDEMERKVKLAKARSLRLEIHAIGDLAAEQVLDTLEKCSIDPATIPILTHCQVLRKDLIERMRQMNVVANVQPSFVPTDMEWVQKRLTKSKQEFSYVWKYLFKDAGVHVAGGSDSPVETPSPLVGMYDAMFRCSRVDDNDIYKPDQKLTFAEALYIYTMAGARASMEPLLGDIKVGKAGDLVFLPAELEDNYEMLKTIKARRVVVAGKVVYEHKGDGKRCRIV